MKLHIRQLERQNRKHRRQAAEILLKTPNSGPRPKSRALS